MEEAKPVRKTSQLAWALVSLGAVAIIVDMLSITALGTNANNTFHYVGKDSPQRQPIPAAPRPPVANSPSSNP